MSKQIFSSLTSDQSYTIYREDTPKGAPAVVKVVDGKPMSIVIKGGSGVANEYIQTPKGVCTEVSDQAFAMLETCPMFNRHKERRFIKVHEKKISPEKVLKDMEPKDLSAPLVDSDFVAGEAPTLNTPAQ